MARSCILMEVIFFIVRNNQCYSATIRCLPANLSCMMAKAVCRAVLMQLNDQMHFGEKKQQNSYMNILTMKHFLYRHAVIAI